MPKVTVVDMTGKEVDTIELSEGVFGIEPNVYVMHEAVVNYLANQRQGTQSALTRSEVSGGGRKPWRQKGTGHARQGSIRAPQWTHGGIVFAPKPRSYRYSINKKVRRLAMKSAFSAKLRDGEILVLDSMNLSGYKTKEVVNMLKDLKVEKKAMIVMPENDDLIIKSSRNIPGVCSSRVECLSVYSILNAGKLIILKDAVKKIEEVYA